MLSFVLLCFDPGPSGPSPRTPLLASSPGPPVSNDLGDLSYGRRPRQFSLHAIPRKYAPCGAIAFGSFYLASHSVLPARSILSFFLPPFLTHARRADVFVLLRALLCAGLLTAGCIRWVNRIHSSVVLFIPVLDRSFLTLRPLSVLTGTLRPLPSGRRLFHAPLPNHRGGLAVVVVKEALSHICPHCWRTL